MNNAALVNSGILDLDSIFSSIMDLRWPEWKIDKSFTHSKIAALERAFIDGFECAAKHQALSIFKINPSALHSHPLLEKSLAKHIPKGHVIIDDHIYLKLISLLNQERNIPTIVCLCGSSRFGHVFNEANKQETLSGKIVLSIGCNLKSDEELFKDLKEYERVEIKRKLDNLHFRKIEIADEVLILNVGGYVGESTANELFYATKLGKTIRWWEPDNISEALICTQGEMA